MFEGMTKRDQVILWAMAIGLAFFWIAVAWLVGLVAFLVGA